MLLDISDTPLALFCPVRGLPCVVTNLIVHHEHFVPINVLTDGSRTHERFFFLRKHKQHESKAIFPLRGVCPFSGDNWLGHVSLCLNQHHRNQ